MSRMRGRLFGWKQAPAILPLVAVRLTFINPHSCLWAAGFSTARGKNEHVRGFQCLMKSLVFIWVPRTLVSLPPSLSLLYSVCDSEDMCAFVCVNPQPGLRLKIHTFDWLRGFLIFFFFTKLLSRHIHNWSVGFFWVRASAARQLKLWMRQVWQYVC